MSDFVPANQLARMYGVKGMYYGPAGGGKTPMLQTAPRPLLLAIEPGLGSLRNSNVPTYDAINNLKRVDEFFKWLLGSHEVRNFDTIGLDSGSYLAELIRLEELSKKSNSGAKVDGKAAYGEISKRTYRYLFDLYALQQKHVYLTCKQGTANIDGMEMTVPYFPGKDLYSTVPGLYDVIAQVGKFQVPGYGEQRAIRMRGTMTTLARHRTDGQNANPCNDFEPCDLTALFGKIMS